MRTSLASRRRFRSRSAFYSATLATAITVLAVPGAASQTASQTAASQTAASQTAASQIASLTGTPFVTANPDLADNCDISITMVLDASGSVEEAATVPVMRAAGLRLVSSLADRNVAMSVVEFGTFADVPVPPTVITSASVASVFGPYLAGTGAPAYSSTPGRVGQSTNWEDGLRVAGTLPTADLVLLLTTDQPDTVGNAATATANNLDDANAATEAARAFADRLKTAGSHLYALGFGGVNTPEGVANLQAISGPDLAGSAVFGAADYHVGNIDELLAAIDDTAQGLCGGSVVVTSLIDADGDATTTADRSPAADVDIIVTPEEAIAGKSAGITNSGGSAWFNLDMSNGPRRISIGQQTLPDYAVLQASCTGSTTPGSFSAPINLNDVTVGSDDLVRCVFVNSRLPVDLGIEKKVTQTVDNDASGNLTPGDSITYSIKAVNEGAGSLSGVTVIDPLLPKLTCDRPMPASLLSGAVVTCTGTYAIPADFAGTVIVNTAMADANETPAVTDTVTTALADSELEFNKSVVSIADKDSSGDNSAGDVVTYELVAKNTGATELTTVTISDPMIEPLSCDDALPVVALKPEQSVTCRGTYVLTSADVRTGGTFVNRATASSDQTGSVEDTATLTIPTLSLQFNKAIDRIDDRDANGEASGGDVVHYVMTATNVGSSNLSEFTIDDPMLGSFVCNPAIPQRIAPTGSISCTGSYTVKRSDHGTTVTNTATASTRQSGSVTDTAEFTVRRSLLSMSNQVAKFDDLDDSGDMSPGDVIHYALTATNAGEMTLTNVAVIDPMFPTLVCDPTATQTLTAGAQLRCSATLTLTTAHLDSTIANTASATSRQTDPVSAENAIVIGRPQVSVETSLVGDIDGDSLAPGDVLTYRVVVTNAGTANLSRVAVADDKLDQLTCEGLSGNRLLAGTTAVCTGTRTITDADPGTTIVNVIRVSSVQLPTATDEVVLDIGGGAACPASAILFGEKLVAHVPGSPAMAQDVFAKPAAGRYRVTLISSDVHHSVSYQPWQTDERWVLEFLDEHGNVVAQTPVTEDIPDADQRIVTRFVDPIDVPNGVVTLRARHGFPDYNPNSVVAECAVLRRIGDIPTVAPVAAEPE